MYELVISDSENQKELFVVEYGTHKCHPNSSCGPSVRDFYIIHYIHSGKGYFRLGSKEFTIKKGQAFAIYPNVISHYCADSSDPWNYTWIAFKGNMAENYLRKTGFTIENPLINYNADFNIENYFTKIIDSKVYSKTKQAYLLGLLYLILSYNEQDKNQISESINISKPDYIHKAMDFIKYNYSKKISIRDIAKYCGIESKYLCMLFKKQLETSPYQLLQKTRMEKARELLKNKELAISDVSRSVGYSDPLLFSKMFKRYTGVPPKKSR